MSVKFIAITQRLVENSSYYEVREALSLEWGAFFKANLNGFLPLPLSYEIPFIKYVESLGDSLCGVILSGGNDLGCFSDSGISKMRDSYEKGVIEACVKFRIPLLGICRGAQMIAWYFGSSLKKCSGHVGEHLVEFCESFRAVGAESCEVESCGIIPNKSGIAKSGIANWQQGQNEQKEYLVNSYHNFGIFTLGKDLEAVAYASDGSVEAFKHSSKNIFGIMWHIERIGCEAGLEIINFKECLCKKGR